MVRPVGRTPKAPYPSSGTGLSVCCQRLVTPRASRNWPTEVRAVAMPSATAWGAQARAMTKASTAMTCPRFTLMGCHGSAAGRRGVVVRETPPSGVEDGAMGSGSLLAEWRSMPATALGARAHHGGVVYQPLLFSWGEFFQGCAYLPICQLALFESEIPVHGVPFQAAVDGRGCGGSVCGCRGISCMMQRFLGAQKYGAHESGRRSPPQGPM